MTYNHNDAQLSSYIYQLSYFDIKLQCAEVHYYWLIFCTSSHPPIQNLCSAVTCVQVCNRLWVNRGYEIHTYFYDDLCPICFVAKLNYKVIWNYNYTSMNYDLFMLKEQAISSWYSFLELYHQSLLISPMIVSIFPTLNA